MSRGIFAILAASLLGACESTPPQPATIAGRTFAIISIDGQPLPTLLLFPVRPGCVTDLAGRRPACCAADDYGAARTGYARASPRLERFRPAALGVDVRRRTRRALGQHRGVHLPTRTGLEPSTVLTSHRTHL